MMTGRESRVMPEIGPCLVQCFVTFLLEVTDLFKKLSGLGWWIVPLDKGLFKEIPGINSSWGKSVHPPFSGSSECDGKNV
ncbi:hypothetical protein Tco_0316152 [Tanacetum coccineum]